MKKYTTSPYLFRFHAFNVRSSLLRLNVQIFPQERAVIVFVWNYISHISRRHGFFLDVEQDRYSWTPGRHGFRDSTTVRALTVYLQNVDAMLNDTLVSDYK